MAESVIKIYREKNFNGEMKEYQGAVSNLEATGFDDEGSSVVVDKGIWALFNRKQFQGSVWVYGETDRQNLEWGASHCVSSLLPLHHDPTEQPELIMYHGTNLNGRSIKLTKSVSNVAHIDFTNFNSIQVNGGVWIGYSQPNYVGKQYVLQKGNWPDTTSCFANLSEGSIQSFKVLHGRNLKAN